MVCPSDGSFFMANPFAPCSHVYYGCASRRPFEFLCATDALAFDTVSMACLQRQFVGACGGVATTTTVQSVTERDPSLPRMFSALCC